MSDKKEYIERERISGVLPPTCPYGDEYSDGYNTCLETVKDLIREAPAADVVEVVRCRNCKYSRVSAWKHWCHNPHTPWSKRHSEPDHFQFYEVNAEDFCSYGERKDGDNNAAD